ncbi:MAG: transglutaminase domain-containing protein [Bacilli bacterium]|nr:transglutaminase domain-containing protein [Bacilli bacterium]MDD4608457.1 transglutaminase domain-containing protein [Bacilli bacterium]
MKKFIIIFITLIAVICASSGVYKIYYNYNKKPNSDDSPTTIDKKMPTHPYGFDYLDNWQKNLYKLLESDSLKIGDEHLLDETKKLEYVKIVIDLYYQNNPTRPTPKTYSIVENEELKTDPNDPTFKYNVGIGTVNKIRIGQWAYSNINEEMKRYKEIDKKTDEIISMFPKNATDYSKLKIIFDYLVNNVKYDYETVNNNNIDLDSTIAYGALIKNKAICGGMSQAFHYVASKAGFYTLYISSARLNHDWNRVWFNGQFYKIDITNKLFLTNDYYSEDYVDGIPLQQIDNNYDN